MKICGVAVHALLLSCYMLNGFALIFFIVMRLCLLAPTEQAPAANFFLTSLNVTHSSLLLQTDLLSGPNYHEAAVIKNALMGRWKVLQVLY